MLVQLTDKDGTGLGVIEIKPKKGIPVDREMISQLWHSYCIEESYEWSATGFVDYLKERTINASVVKINLYLTAR